jgi:uncharacterized protein
MAAAWAMHTVLKDRAAYVPCTYDKREHTNYDVLNKDVYFVDFSGTREEIEMLSTMANRVFVIDHHKTAKEALSGTFPANVTVIFDMNKSGARLAWEFSRSMIGERLIQEHEVPWLVRYVEDGDLWRFALKESKLIRAYIGIHDYTFEAYNGLHASMQTDEGLDRCIFIGSIVRQTNMHMVNEAVKTLIRRKGDQGRTYMTGNVVNQISETGNEALIQNPDVDYTMTYFDKMNPLTAETTRVFSLRSRAGSNVDVSAIAKQHGGGGHENAAGFSKSVGYPLFQ